MVKWHARVIESKVGVDRVAVAPRAAPTVRAIIEAGVCGLVPHSFLENKSKVSKDKSGTEQERSGHESMRQAPNL